MIGVIVRIILALLMSYLLGSVSFAVVVSKYLEGEDVRQKGSGNAGATNMLRNYGWIPAAMTFVGDLAKGSIAVLLGRMLTASTPVALYGGFLCGFAVLFGHMKPLFFGFQGGKGVATGLGAVLALNPLVCAIMAVVAIPLAGFSGYVSLASIICAGAYPFVLAVIRHWQNRFDLLEVLLAAALGWTIVYNHRKNIQRLCNGTERRFLPSKKSK
ncbi:MAG: glycerol-3-phosphate 1-O-acyltransferase PlsY [Oscillospiraceae bacterium]